MFGGYAALELPEGEAFDLAEALARIKEGGFGKEGALLDECRLVAGVRVTLGDELSDYEFDRIDRGAPKILGCAVPSIRQGGSP